MEAGLLVKYPYKTWKHKTKQGVFAYQAYEWVPTITVVNEAEGRKVIKTESLVFFQDEISDYELV
jgi:hypothetical protein